MLTIVLTYLIYSHVYLLTYLLIYSIIHYQSNNSRYTGTDAFVAVYTMKPANMSISFISPKPEATFLSLKM